MENVDVGMRVEKLGSAKDYTTGRTGTVVQTNAIEHHRDGKIWPLRARVLWDYGNIRTWVKVQSLKIIS
jgi:hypothetical protein